MDKEQELQRLLNDEQRTNRRTILQTPIGSELTIEGQNLPIKLVDYSHHGLGLIFPKTLVDPEQLKLSTSSISFSSHQFQGKVVHLQDQKHHFHAGFSLPNPEATIFNMDLNHSAHDIVDSPKMVEAIFKDAAFLKIACPIDLYQGSYSLKFYPLMITSNNTMIGEVKDTYNPGITQDGEALCSFMIYQTRHVFKSQVKRVSVNQIEITLADKLTRVLRRETLRVVAPKATSDFTVSIKSQIINQDFTDRHILNYSEHGISLIDYQNRYAFPQGMPLERITLNIKGIGTIEGSAIVRNYIWNRDKQSYVLGLEVTIPDESSHAQWHNFILKQRYPNFDFEYKDEDHQKIWDLFERSGYLDFKPRNRFDSIKMSTKEAWKTLSSQGFIYSKRPFIRQGDKIISGFQLDKFYSKTWLLHHFCMDPSYSNFYAKDLFSLLIDLLVSGESKFLLSFTDISRAWNSKIYYKFSKRFNNELSVLRLYQTFELDLISDNFKITLNNNCSIKKIKNDEIESIVGLLSTHYTEIEMNALSLYDDPLLNNVNEKRCALKMLRERSFYKILNKEKDIVGALIFESGITGLNIIGVQDAVYPVFFKGDLDESYTQNIIFEIVKFYKKKEKRHILVQIENKDRITISYGMNFMCDSNRWIVRSDTFKSYSVYTNNIYGSLKLKKQKIIDKINEKNR